MARCSGRLLCICLLPCVMVGHLIVYIMVSICITISYSPPLLPVRFVAPGTSSNSGTLASHPLNPFWKLGLEEGALWNQLQRFLDRQHNPILRGNRTWVKLPDAEDGRVREGDAGEAPADCRPDNRWASRLQDFNTLPEQMRDFVLSMHCRDYPLLTDQPGICGGEGQGAEAPVLLLAIKSETGNFENRQAIRQTWGQSGWVQGEAGGRGGLVRTVFLLGKQDPSAGLYPDLEALLELEKSQHQDILQWDFRDSFYNLTLKDVLFWRWFSLRCPRALFVFKGDDDIFLRTRSLLDFLHQQGDESGDPGQNSTERTRDLFVGEVIANAGPNRQPSTKYYIPESFYKGTYPAYAGGGGVVYSGDLALRLGRVSRRVHLFPIDDVYLGMCLHRLGISPSHHPGFLTFDLPASDREKPCAYRSVILVHKRSPKEMLRLWSELQTVPPPC
ncbi:N-acetyllactosaminide beta-1,3-N-acetylglucosaminyltransferase 2 [Megalops cyprinoides]|uniref:N-acetyllactosaminide beta-1,3-N-acetylglucosaminyltransferase 2 n=1 Tax=Megalops cyprinoides TaxID=118141 RepID=UPI0018640E8B|nr:N-acetyllactosaminide beta-1,3-N-acetylglucosaminyltransferase 2 [Megalops cyprinoides]